jgi:hypothetical protein
MSSITVVVDRPDDSEVIAWWQWASSFVSPMSPFDIPGGRFDANQIYNVFCMSCTAGNGGNENRTLPRITKDSILVPVFVAGSPTSFDDALNELGLDDFFDSANVKFKVNQSTKNVFFKAVDVGGLTFQPGNPFGPELDGTHTHFYSVGFWAKVSPANGVTRIKFGGSRGRKHNGGNFDTEVDYS